MCTMLSFACLAEEKDSKSFLFLFKAKELKQLKMSLKEIESQFSSFKTKTYGGNSELALIIETPAGNFDECFVGQFLVRTKENINVRLEEIAFRMIDLTESKQLKNQLLLAYEATQQTKKAERKSQKP